MQQESSPVLQQQRSLHSGALHTLHQSPDGTLYPQTLPELQNLHTNDTVFQHHPYGISGPPQPSPHVLPVQFEQHALPPSQFPLFPSDYQHTVSPRFALSTSPLPGATPQFHTPQPIPIPLPLPPLRPPQQLPLPPPPRVLTAPQSLPSPVEHVQPPSQPQARDGYVAVSNHF